mmetsp:Transcript_54542/g.115867  ORF Transcript_54542/g.115867 Transcript_54542/m.115867 type:complete len:128 (-) Transcript_54542:280-663(-)
MPPGSKHRAITTAMPRAREPPTGRRRRKRKQIIDAAPCGGPGDTSPSSRRKEAADEAKEREEKGEKTPAFLVFGALAPDAKPEPEGGGSRAPLVREGDDGDRPGRVRREEEAVATNSRTLGAAAGRT